MELVSQNTGGETYQRIGPFIYNDETIGIVEGNYVVERVRRAFITGIDFECRSSFKHPIIGLILGLVLVTVPVQAVMGDPLGLWWLTLASPHRVAGTFFMFLFGIYLIWAVLRRRNE